MIRKTVCLFWDANDSCDELCAILKEGKINYHCDDILYKQGTHTYFAYNGMAFVACLNTKN